MNKQQGFTLIELLMVMVIIGLVVTLGIPNVVDVLKNNRIATSTNNFIAVLNYARGEAITQHDNRGVNITLEGKASNKFNKLVLWRDCTDTGASTDCPATRINTTNSATDNGSYQTTEVIRELLLDAPIFMTTSDWGKIDSTRMLPANTTAITTNNTLNFGADGRLSSTQTRYEFWICDNRKNEPITRLRLYRTGRVAVKKFYPSDDATEYAKCPN